MGRSRIIGQFTNCSAVTGNSVPGLAHEFVELVVDGLRSELLFLSSACAGEVGIQGEQCGESSLIERGEDCRCEGCSYASVCQQANDDSGCLSAAGAESA